MNALKTRLAGFGFLIWWGLLLLPAFLLTRPDYSAHSVVSQDIQAAIAHLKSASAPASIAEAIERLLLNLSKPDFVDLQATLHLLCCVCLVSFTRWLLPSGFRRLSFHSPESFIPYISVLLLVFYLPIVAMISTYSPGLLHLLVILTLATIMLCPKIPLLETGSLILPLLALLMMLRTEIFWPIWTLTGIYLFICKHQRLGPVTAIETQTQAPSLPALMQASCSFASLVLTWLASALVILMFLREIPLLKQLHQTQEALRGSVQNLFFTPEGDSMMTLAPQWLLSSIRIPELHPFIYALHAWLTGAFLLGFPVWLRGLYRASMPFQAKLTSHAVLIVTLLSCVLLNNGQLRPDSNAGLLGVGMLFTLYYVLSPLRHKQKIDLPFSLLILFLIFSTGLFSCLFSYFPGPNKANLMLAQLLIWTGMGLLYFGRNTLERTWRLFAALWVAGVLIFGGMPLLLFPQENKSSVSIQGISGQSISRHIDVPASFFSKKLAAVYLMFETEPMTTHALTRALTRENSENLSLTVNELGLDLQELNQEKPQGFVKTRYASLKLPQFVLDSVQSKHAAEITLEQLGKPSNPLNLVHDQAWSPKDTPGNVFYIPSPDLCDYSTDKALFDGDGRHLLPFESLDSDTIYFKPRILLVGVWQKHNKALLKPDKACPSGPIAY
ncbi:MAG: hypothetical protein K2X01_10670 [Cyanobacteria bacterium]|nr:hypothetical protein [Cyanobacteriota bacterium]